MKEDNHKGEDIPQTLSSCTTNRSIPLRVTLEVGDVIMTGQKRQKVFNGVVRQSHYSRERGEVLLE